MDSWLIEPKPAADLIVIDLDPKPRPDGGTVQLFRTTQGVVHARVVEPSGQVLWMQRVER